MLDSEYLAAPFEVKLAQSGAADGTFEGYGSVFGHRDSHGDVVMPGAFTASLAERKAQGRGLPTMHVMHAFLGGDGLPAGVWTDASEDSKGLHLKGKLSAMDTDYGKRIYGLVKDGALKGLSIGFNVAPGGAVKAVGGTHRELKAVNLHEVSLVADPSNAMALVTEMRSRAGMQVRATSMPAKAADAVASAIALHLATLGGSNSPSADQRAEMLDHLQTAHEALTGQRMPDGVKAAIEGGELAEIKALLAQLLDTRSLPEREPLITAASLGF